MEEAQVVDSFRNALVADRIEFEARKFCPAHLIVDLAVAFRVFGDIADYLLNF